MSFKVMNSNDGLSMDPGEGFSSSHTDKKRSNKSWPISYRDTIKITR